MKLKYVAYGHIAGEELMLMGGGMGNPKLFEEPLRLMASPDSVNAAVDEAHKVIVKEIKKAQKQGRVLSKVVYECVFCDGANLGGVLVEGAYVELTAEVEYE